MTNHMKNGQKTVFTPSRSPLPIRDTPRVYGAVSRLLHWLMAMLMVWQFLGMGLRQILGRVPLVSFFVGSHQQVGTVLFLLILLRVIWSMVNFSNRPAHGVGPMGFAARFGHSLLYLAMLIVPALALLRAYGSKRTFSPFGFEIFPPRSPQIEWMVKLGNDFHGEISWFLSVLILGHVVMVGVHKAMWRDDILARMAGTPAKDSAQPPVATRP